MSRSTKGKKAPGYEYWSRRPVSNKGGCTPGRISKKCTHKAERREGRAMANGKDMA